MTIKDFKENNILNDDQDILKEFSEYINLKNQTDSFKQTVNEYAKGLFDERESFITAINLLMKEKYDIDKFCKFENIYDSVEVKIKLLKYLQGKETGKSRLDIAEHFNVSENTISKRLLELQSIDNQVLGKKVSIELERTTNLYDSTIHPLLLTLNLSEVYGLIITLGKASNSLFGTTIKDIISDIVVQLTDYAADILSESGLNIDSYKNRYINEFRNESKKTQLLTLMKTKSQCTIQFKNRDKPLTGILKMGKSSSKFFLFVSNKGEKIPLNDEDIKDIIEIESNKSVLH